MASRTSARAAAASSPPKQLTSSPMTRRMRTRSASVELGGNNAAPAKKGKRGARQASVESVGSNTSAASDNRGGRRTKATRGAIKYPDLSNVAEEKEVEEAEDDEEEEEAEGAGLLPRSPGSMSQMSGTTAITSASAQTSHTTAELAELDATLVVEILPDLWVSSLQILALTPTIATVESVDSLVRELKVPGSAQAKRLMHREQKFTVDREKFGNDTYIRPSFILQKVFGSQDMESGLLRPDAILQAGNLATFIKELLVKQKEGLDTFQFLSNLDTWFPESFVAQFEDNVQFGNSNLSEESFDLALEIRTQYAIVALHYHNSGEAEWDPDQVLTELFFDPLVEYSEELSLFDDTFENGVVKSLMRAGPDNTHQQQGLIKVRVMEIYNTFRESEDAAQAGDLVDWDQLEEQFPWSGFQAKAVQWARSRQDEIMESVRLQGGVDEIVKSFVETIKNNNSQVELNFEPYPSTSAARQLLPPAEIIPATTGHDLMNQSTVRLMQAMKSSSSRLTPAQGKGSAATSKNAVFSSSRRATPPPRRGPPSRRATDPESAEDPHQSSDAFVQIEDADDGPTARDATTRSSAAYGVVWQNHIQSENKENTPEITQEKGNAAKRVNKQGANAQRVQWNIEKSQETRETAAGPSKRKHPATTENNDSDDDFSQDEGFQTDQRNLNPSLRRAAIAARQPVLAREPATKRVRIGDDSQAAAASLRRERDEVELQASAARMRRERDEAELQASARQGASEEEIDDEPAPRARARRQAVEEDEDLDPFEGEPPSATQIAVMARQRAALVRQRTAKTQTRTPWSEGDTTQFKDLIEEYGCSWSAIERAAVFETSRSQVQLKDKARNMKVAYLKLGIPLPLNFEKIALGRKEILSVQSVLPDYNGDP